MCFNTEIAQGLGSYKPEQSATHDSPGAHLSCIRLDLVEVFNGAVDKDATAIYSFNRGNKGAVSGCIRECAEAQSKDFGIIATEKGWNLYVCGNGGSRPQHAKLFATDVDTETCVKLIDRFLMFYIRTADPLTRTASWLNKMEGGLEYLRDVIINDSLGIGEQLEKDMKNLIATYECEWKKVVETPSLRAAFRHFANDESPDDTLSFVDLRGQKCPSDWNKK